MPEAVQTEVARTEYETMVYERKGKTGYIMFNRPQVLNAVNDQFEQDLANEPDRIRDFYAVRAQRIEPVGLVYLWPETN